MKDEILDLIRRFVDHEYSSLEFQEKFGPLYFRARSGRVRSRDANAICNEVIVLIAEHSRGHRSEDSLRKELENAVGLFVELPRVSSRVIERQIGQPLVTNSNSALFCQMLLKEG